MLIAGGLLIAGLPENAQTIKPKMDVWGTVVMVLATTTLFIGFSWLGAPDKRGLGVLLLLVSVAAWIGFLRLEKRAEAPILDPQIFMNRTFMTAAGAAFLSFFGMLGIMAYSPIFVQMVMQISPTVSGSMLTPYTMIVAFMGIPTGLTLARTRKYKSLYLFGYALVTVALFAMWQFTARMPVGWYILVTAVAGFGVGMIGTITTLVAQFAVPRRLLGVAVGAIFFFQMIGLVVAPSILGLVQSSAPDLESGLKMVFLIGAVALTMALLLILTIPEISMEAQAIEESEPGKSGVSIENSLS